MRTINHDIRFIDENGNVRTLLEQIEFEDRRDWANSPERVYPNAPLPKQVFWRPAPLSAFRREIGNLINP